MLALGERLEDLAVLTRLSEEEPRDPLAGRAQTCNLVSGVVPMYRRMAADIAAAGALSDPQASIFVTDLFSALWLMGAGRPVPGAALWNYGQVEGAAAADYIAVPSCPARTDLRDRLLAALEAVHPRPWQEVLAADSVTLYRPAAAAAAAGSPATSASAR